jgi:ATP-dependent exoDNAse (exonuclease V) alpha subunit
MNIELSEDQEKVYNTIAKWLAEGGIVHPKQKKANLLTMAGYGGTGKTTVISMLAKEFSKSIRFGFCALSGKAASVLRNKLTAQGVSFSPETNYCGTIHGMIYMPIENENGEVLFWDRNPAIPYDVIVVDEASMVSEDLYNDLATYGVDILAVGDHGQLPPIEGKFSLMADPILRLEKIHRQAENNPIINLSMQVRKEGKIPSNYKENANVKIVKKSVYKDFIQEFFTKHKEPYDILDTAILCYKNATRVGLNNLARQTLFGKNITEPLTNDVLICLKNSKNRKHPLYNGYRGYFSSGVSSSGHYYKSKIIFPVENINVKLNNICKYQFNRAKTFNSFSEFEEFKYEPQTWSDMTLFDYGYSLSVHKSQGSQFGTVVLFNERPYLIDDDTYKRWVYTGISRSSENLVLII